MEYEKVRIYEKSKLGKEKNLSKKEGLLEFALKAIDNQVFEMPMVCH